MSDPSDQPSSFLSVPLDLEFDNDDKHFRTVTTLLGLVSRPDSTTYNVRIPTDARKNITILRAATALLARSFDVVACIPKQTISAPAGQPTFTLFCVKSNRPLREKDYEQHQVILNRNPDRKSESSAVNEGKAIMQVSEVNYKTPKPPHVMILETWGDNDYTKYVQAISSLFRQVTAKNKEAQGHLTQYASFFSSRKLLRRFKSHHMKYKHAEVLRHIDIDKAVDTSSPTADFLATKFIDVESLLIDKHTNNAEFEDLRAFLRLNKAAWEPGNAMKQFHIFILKMLDQYEKGIKRLAKWYDSYNKNAKDKGVGQKPNSDDLDNVLVSVFASMTLLSFMGWHSKLFNWYIKSFLGSQIDSATSTDKLYEFPPKMDEDDDLEDSTPDEGVDIDDTEEFANDHFDAHGLPPHARPTSRPGDWISWLRVATSPRRHAQTLFDSSLSRRYAPIKLHIIQTPIPSTTLRPWPDVIRQLFPSDEADTLIDNISCFSERMRKSIVEFRGAPHCEAVLATLHFLQAKPETAQSESPLVNSSPIITASKSCCPVCAFILHTLSGGSRVYPIFRKHRNITACALPPGLPVQARKKVIAHFEGLLKEYYSEELKLQRSNLSTETVPSDEEGGKLDGFIP